MCRCSAALALLEVRGNPPLEQLPAASGQDSISKNSEILAEDNE